MTHQVASSLKRGAASLVMNSAFLIANTLAGSCFGFLFWLIVARSHQQEQVGLAAASISALTLLTMLGELGLGTALIRFAPSLGTRRDGLINSALAATSLCTLGLAALFAVVAPRVSPELGWLARSWWTGLFLLAALAVAVGQLLDSLFVAFQATHLAFARNLGSNLVRLAVALALGPSYGAGGVLLAVGAGALVTASVALGALAPRAVPGYRFGLACDLRQLRENLSYTLGNHLAALLWAAPTLVYPLMIVALLGASANAQFYLSWMVANLLFIVPTAVATSTFAQAANKGASVDGEFWRTMRRTLLLVLPLAGVLAAAGPWVLQLFGEGYSAAGNALLLSLAASSLPYTVNSFTIAYHRIRQDVRGVMLVAGLATLLCLTMSAWLGTMLGLAGVGAGWLAGQTASVLVALPSRRHIGPKATADPRFSIAEWARRIWTRSTSR